MVTRPKDSLRAELTHVLWVQEELPRWDSSVVTAGARTYLAEHYRQREQVLRVAMEERVEPAPRPVAPVNNGWVGGELPRARRVLKRPTPVAPPAPRAPVVVLPPLPPPAPVEAVEPAPAMSAATALVELEPPTPTVDDEVVAEASAWHRFWKPFLSESVGWFIGGFLILVGTLYWVADAWATMSGTTRSFTVFGFAAAWTLGFTAWARFLGRRDTTRAAGRVLALIAAAVAPLAPIALGPIATTAPLLFLPALAAWSAFVFALTRSVAADRDARGTLWHATGAALTTALMGAAPVVVGGPSAVWLMIAPLATFALAARGGTREQPGFALLAPLYLLGLFGVRLHVAMAAASALPHVATWAPFAAAGLYAALQLRPRGKTDALSIAAISLQAALLLLSAAGDAPAFFVTSAVLCATALRLTRGDARWTYPAYVGAYFAFQTCGQLIPSQLKVLLGHLREALGYTASQPLPAAYDAIYAAVFVIAGGLLAARRLKSDPRAPRAGALLTATGWAAALIGAMGLESVAHDARPALWSAPFVAALCLTLGPLFGRRTLSWVGAALAAFTGVALVSSLGAGGGAVAVAGLAVVLGVAGVFMLAGHRQPFAAGAGGLALLAIGASFFHPTDVSGLVAIALASVAALVAARNLDSDELLTLAFFAPACLLPKLALIVAPGLIAPALAVSGLGLALLSRGQRRLSTASLAAWASVIAAPLYQLSTGTSGGGVLGVTLLVAALALFVGRRTLAAQATGIVFIALAVLPFGGELQPLPFITPVFAAYLALAASLFAAVHAGVTRRTWQAALIASLAIAVSWTCGIAAVPLTLAALTALVASRALLPSIGVPLATLFGAAALVAHDLPLGLLLLLVAVTAVSLLEEWDFSWAHLLGRSRVAWAASLSGLALGVVAIIACVAMNQLVLATLIPAACALVWARATRFPLFGFVAPVFALVPQLIDPGNLHAWAVAVGVVALTRALQLSPHVRVLLVGERDTASKARWLQNAVLAGLAVMGVVVGHQGTSLLPIIAALLLSAGMPTAWRVAAATGFVLAVPGLAPLAAVGFIVLALAARHSPRAARWVLGDEQRSWTVAAFSVASVVCAARDALLTPAAFPAAALLAGCLAVCAVMLGWRWLLSVAVVVFALPLALALHPALSADAALRAALVAGIAAALAALSRLPGVSHATLRRLAHVGRAFDGPVATPLWLGAAVALAVTLPTGHAPLPLTLCAAALLLVTGVGLEAGAAVALLGLTLFVAVPAGLVASVIGLTGFALCAAGALLEREHAVGRVWHHAGWLLSLAAVALVPGLDAAGTPVTLAAVAGCGWALALRKPRLEWLAWSGTAIAAHFGLFFAGLRLGHGQPHELILPWCGLVMVVLGAVALAVKPNAQRYAAGLTALVLGLAEVVGGAALLSGPFVREAVVAAVAVAVAVLALGRRVVKHDDAIAMWVAQAALALGFVAVRWLGLHAGPDTVTAFAALAFGAVLGGAARVLPSNASAAARSGAWLWPLLGLCAAPFAQLWLVAALLLAQSLHFAVLSQGAAAGRRRFATLSSLAFNAALAAGWLAAGAGHVQYLLVPVGLSALVLLKLFERDFEVEALQRLRATAVTVIYAAAAFEPLAFSTPWALWLCAAVCVVGVGAGIALKVRSYVFLGTGFLVTTVVASLTRYGIAQPRVGALLLSGLGLVIVAFMVLITTRRSELLMRYQRARSMLAQWQG